MKRCRMFWIVRCAVAAFVVVSAGPRSAASGTPVADGVEEEVVVVGSRRAGLSALESKSPVHVVNGAELRERGGTDMLDLLRDSVPSFNVNMQPIADGATIVRPPNIRNLAADHTLVMVNGKRRHRGAVIAWLVPKASEGAQGPDLSVFPSMALERVGSAAGWRCRAVRFRRRRRRDELCAQGRRRGRRGRVSLRAHGGGGWRSVRGRRQSRIRSRRRRVPEPQRGVRRDRGYGAKRAARRRGGVGGGRKYVRPQSGTALGQPRSQRQPQDLRESRLLADGAPGGLCVRQLRSQGNRRRLLLPQSKQPRGRIHPRCVPPGGRSHRRWLRRLSGRPAARGPLLRERRLPGGRLSRGTPPLLCLELAFSRRFYAAFRRPHAGLFGLRRPARRAQWRLEVGPERRHGRE